MWHDSRFDRPQTGLTQAPPAARNGGIAKAPCGRIAGVTMREFMAITKALADENRVRMLLALQGRELCLCQIIELVALAPSTVSKHMSILHQARLVEGRKTGRWMYYRLAGADASPVVRDALQWVLGSLAGDAQALLDVQRLQELLALDPEELCQRRCAPPHRRSATRL